MRGMEALLKKKSPAKGRRTDEKPHTEPDPPTQGPAAEPPPESPAELSPLDKSYYMGLYFLCFHRYSIRKFVNILPAIFGR